MVCIPVCIHNSLPKCTLSSRFESSILLGLYFRSANRGIARFWCSIIRASIPDPHPSLFYILSFSFFSPVILPTYFHLYSSRNSIFISLPEFLPFLLLFLAFSYLYPSRITNFTLSPTFLSQHLSTSLTDRLTLASGCVELDRGGRAHSDFGALFSSVAAVSILGEHAASFDQFVCMIQN